MERIRDVLPIPPVLQFLPPRASPRRAALPVVQDPDRRPAFAGLARKALAAPPLRQRGRVAMSDLETRTAARTDGDEVGLQQYGALPWRLGRCGIEVLLITSRRRGRWIVPKGWLVKGRSPAQSAAAARRSRKRAVIGRAYPAPVGDYVYMKFDADGFAEPCRVTCSACMCRARSSTGARRSSASGAGIQRPQRRKSLPSRTSRGWSTLGSRGWRRPPAMADRRGGR